VTRLATRVVRFAYDRRRLVTWAIPHGMTVPVRGPGFTILVRPDDWAVGMRIAVKRAHETHVTQHIEAALKPGMTVLDVGANIGWFTLLAAARVGPAGRVHAFEPGRANLELLRLSLTRNGFDNVTLHACAASDREGTLGYSADDSNGHVTADAQRAGVTPVRAVRLDDVLADEPRLDLVKIDIEGSEALALAGMRRLMRRHRPVAFVEFSPGALRSVANSEPRDVLSELRAVGHELLVIRRDGSLDGPLVDERILASVSPVDPADHLDLLARPAHR
jgi:FkbM family methyltransferase